MHSRRQMAVIDNCVNCEARKERLFCDLSAELLQELNSLKFSSFYPKGAMLFMEGQSSRGVFVLCTGRVKLMSSSSDGKTLMRVAEAGEVLGLSATISGKPYEVTAEILESCQVNFIRGQDFLKFLQDHGDVCLRIAKLLSNDYQIANGQVRSLGLSGSAAEKLAKLILGWGDENGQETEQGIRIKLGLTHEEMGQMIGTSRETVTRLLGDFKGKNIIQLKGSTLIINDKAELESLIAA